MLPSPDRDRLSRRRAGPPGTAHGNDGLLKSGLIRRDGCVSLFGEGWLTAQEIRLRPVAIHTQLVTDYEEIHTERLLMRRWCDSDRVPFAAMNADPEVMRYFPAVLDRGECDRRVDLFEERFDQQGFGLWALEVQESGEFVGFTGLNPMPDGVPGAGDQEVGWRLARHAWHKGYATEAARAALDVGLNRLGLPVIWSMAAVINLPSQAVMRRLDMVPHGLFDHPRIEVGHALRPHVVYAIGQPPANS